MQNITEAETLRWHDGCRIAARVWWTSFRRNIAQFSICQCGERGWMLSLQMLSLVWKTLILHVRLLRTHRCRRRCLHLLTMLRKLMILHSSWLTTGRCCERRWCHHLRILELHNCVMQQKLEVLPLTHVWNAHQLTIQHVAEVACCVRLFSLRHSWADRCQHLTSCGHQLWLRLHRRSPPLFRHRTLTFLLPFLSCLWCRRWSCRLLRSFRFDIDTLFGSRLGVTFSWSSSCTLCMCALQQTAQINANAVKSVAF